QVVEDVGARLQRAAAHDLFLEADDRLADLGLQLAERLCNLLAQSKTPPSFLAHLVPQGREPLANDNDPPCPVRKQPEVSRMKAAADGVEGTDRGRMLNSASGGSRGSETAPGRSRGKPCGTDWRGRRGGCAPAA